MRMNEAQSQLVAYAEQAANVIDKYSDLLDEDQLRALPLVGYGASYDKVAKQLGLGKQTVLQWYRADPNFRNAVIEFKSNAQGYHRSMLNQSMVLAWDRIFEYVSTEYDTADKDNRTLQVQIIKSLLAELGMKQAPVVIQNNINGGQQNVTEESIDIIARRLHEIQTNTVDAEYKLLETIEDDSTEMKYIMHKDSQVGVINKRDDGRLQCHICGDWSLDLTVHIRAEHNMSPARYRNIYQLGDQKFYFETPQEVTDSVVQELVEMNLNEQSDTEYNVSVDVT